MDWDGVLNEIGDLSPIVGTALGGPVGAAVGAGLKGVVSLITGKDDPQQALDVLKADPQKILELEEHTRTLATDLAKARLQDLADARKSMVGLAQSGTTEAWSPAIVSAIIMLGFFSCLIFLFSDHAPISPDKEDLLKTLFGALIPMASGVVNFWLGSSNGAQRKDQYLANSVPAHLVKNNNSL
jgi:hypothetical protein